MDRKEYMRQWREAHKEQLREYHREYGKKYSAENREKINEQRREWRKRTNREGDKRYWIERDLLNYQWWNDYKEQAGGCAICGETILAVLDWHHLDPDGKDAAPSDLVNCSLERKLAELKKCILLCANHHRMLHAGMIVIE